MGETIRVPQGEGQVGVRGIGGDGREKGYVFERTRRGVPNRWINCFQVDCLREGSGVEMRTETTRLRGNETFEMKRKRIKQTNKQTEFISSEDICIHKIAQRPRNKLAGS